MNRREWVALCAASAASGFQAATGIVQVQGLDHVSLSVTDGQKTIDFYRPIFGQDIYLRPNTKAEFRIGIGGTHYLAVNPRPDIPVGIIDHFSIGVKDPEERIRSILAREGIEFTESAACQKLNVFGYFTQYSLWVWYVSPIPGSASSGVRRKSESRQD